MDAGRRDAGKEARMPKVLSIDLLRLDGQTQSRVHLNQHAVEEYAEVISSNGKEWPFPPVDVFHDGSDYFVADGFHRVLAGQQAKRGSVPCNVHTGTARDARIFGMTANDRHGLRMTREDKRACVEWLLDHGGKMTQEAIAEAAGVSKRIVQMIVADRKPKVTPPPPPTATKAQIAPFGTSEGEVGNGEESADSKPETNDQAPNSGDKPDYGKCPNCAGTKWDVEEEGVSCHKCHHPHGEPAGDVDEDRISTQRAKTVKTVEALMRAFDDLQTMKAKKEHAGALEMCHKLLKLAKEWK